MQAPAPAHPQAPARLSIPKLLARAREQKIVCLTAYTAPMARLLDSAVDILLVGDSLGMVLYGYESTLPVSLETMVEHGRAVVKASERALVVVDLPFGSYQQSPAQAFASAARLMAETGCGAVKLEGGIEMAETIGFLVARGIPVMAHIGMTPQSVHRFGSYRARGRDEAETAHLLQDIKAIQQAGAFAVVIENVLEEVAAQLVAAVDILSIGIGASAACSGQVLVTEDICGFESRFHPRFVKTYGNIAAEVTRIAQDYAREVRGGQFPDAAHVTTQVKGK